MTLTAEQSSNKAMFEAAPIAEIIKIIRTAMDEGCIRPCHVYDAVDELICRIQALENRSKRNCDVNTADGQVKRREMTWLEFKRKVGETALRLTSDAVPIIFLHGETEIHPTDIVVGCKEAGDELTLMIGLKEGDSGCEL